MQRYYTIHIFQGNSNPNHRMNFNLQLAIFNTRGPHTYLKTFIIVFAKIATARRALLPDGFVHRTPYIKFQIKKRLFSKEVNSVCEEEEASDDDDDAFEEYYNETKADNEKKDGKLINFRLLRKLPN